MAGKKVRRPTTRKSFTETGPVCEQRQQQRHAAYTLQNESQNIVMCLANVTGRLMAFFPSLVMKNWIHYICVYRMLCFFWKRKNHVSLLDWTNKALAVILYMFTLEWKTSRRRKIRISSHISRWQCREIFLFFFFSRIIHSILKVVKYFWRDIYGYPLDAAVCITYRVPCCPQHFSNFQNHKVSTAGNVTKDR